MNVQNFFLFLFLVKTTIHLSINGDEITDLEWNDNYFYEEVKLWNNTLVTGGVWITVCNGENILGGYNAFPNSGWGANRIYTNLRTHNIIYISFTLWRVDSLNAADGLRLIVDSTVYNIINMIHSNNAQNFCGQTGFKDSKIEIALKQLHSSNDLNIRIQNICDQPMNDESIGIRDLSIVLRNNSGSETNQIFAIGSNPPPLATWINCASGQFFSGTCQPCDPSCKSCFGPSNSDCFRCNNSYYLLDGRCQPCHSSCRTCLGPYFDNCTSCFNPDVNSSSSITYKCFCDNTWEFIYLEEYCSNCTAPYRKIGDRCYDPCSLGHYFYRNGSCLPSCPLPFINSNSHTALFCDFPCSSSFYYRNGSCLGDCNYPFTLNNVSIGSFCEYPCPNNSFFYENGTCLSSCAAYLQIVDYLPWKMCKFPCNHDHYFFSNNTCSVQCLSPFEPVNISIGGLCHFPCPENSYYYSNGSCFPTCNQPFKIINITIGLYCNFPCELNEFYFQNGSCLNSCPFYWRKINDSFGNYCDFPCSTSQFYYSNGSCISSCNTPFTVENSTVGLLCNFPCNIDQYYYNNDTCSNTCPYPWKSRNESAATYCDFPCATDYFYFSNNTCLLICGYPYSKVNITIGSFCNFPCNSNEFFYINGSCMSSCPYPWKIRNETTGNYCEYPCLLNKFYYSNGSCLSVCNPPFYSINLTTGLLCNFPCSPSQFYLANGTCNHTCDFPYVIRNDSVGFYCDFPCQSGKYYYPNGSCLSSCENPMLGLNDSHGLICSFKCQAMEFYFPHNDSCDDYCIAEFKPTITEIGNFCIFPCSNGFYLYSNNSCLNTCNLPFISKSYDFGSYCDFPCRINYFYHTRESICKDTCLPPLLKIDLSVGTICLHQETQELVLVSASVVKSAISGTIAGTAPALLAGSDPTTAVAFMSILQAFYYLLFYNVNYPDNVIAILGSFKVARLDFLPSPLNWVLDEIPDIKSPKRFYENDYTGFFIESTSNSFVVFIIYFAGFLYGFGAGRLLRMNSWVNKLARWIYYKMTIALTLRLFLMQYIELSISSLLQILEINFSSSLLSISSVLSIISFFVTQGYPVFVYRLLSKKNIKFRELQKYEPIIEDYDISNKWCLRFGFILITRKSLTCTVLVLLYHIPLMQILLPWIFNLAVLYFYVRIKPHHREHLNFFDTISEIGFFVLHSCILLLAYLDLRKEFDLEKRQNIGWTMIGVMGGILFFGFLNIWSENLRIGLSMFKKYRALYKNDKNELKKLKRNNINKFKNREILYKFTSRYQQRPM